MASTETAEAENAQQHQNQPIELHETPNASPPQDPDQVPDGGYGWAVVFACFVHAFWINAWTGCWGILQAALLRQTLQHSTSSTVSFVGALGIAMGPGLGTPCVWLARIIGARYTSLLGILCYGLGCIASAQAVSNVGALFFTSGVMYGISAGLMYAMCNTLPVQWFTTKLGTANGIIKLGGGIGATVMSIATGFLTEKVGIAWTFRILGLASLASGIPVVFLIKERPTASRSYALDWTIFKQLPFTFSFISGALGVFAIYTPPFFLPYVADAIGLSNAATTGVVACFNACMAVGRIISGVACDKLGTMNMFFLTMALNAVTFFAVWSVSNTLAVLIVFAVINGIANGAFFVTMPTAVGRLWPEDNLKGGGAISIALTGWFPGLLVGSPIAGALMDAMGAENANSIIPFRPAIFYSGGTALASTGFVLLAGLAMRSKRPAVIKN
uniref:Major facilitator superfamily (MFS) profile domain-containing protein n=1 Tax=Bionectria ochroleuca TaxID=29856 RepID=A0A8H7K869_BIOOC